MEQKKNKKVFLHFGIFVYILTAQQLQYTFPYPIIILQPSLNRSEPKGCSLLPIQQAMGWLFSDLYKLQANW